MTTVGGGQVLASQYHEDNRWHQHCQHPLLAQAGMLSSKSILFILPQPAKTIIKYVKVSHKQPITPSLTTLFNTPIIYHPLSMPPCPPAIDNKKAGIFQIQQQMVPCLAFLAFTHQHVRTDDPGTMNCSQLFYTTDWIPAPVAQSSDLRVKMDNNLDNHDASNCLDKHELFTSSGS